MKIAKSDSISPKIRTSKISGCQSQPDYASKNTQSTNYNPIYYKPLISFKGNGFESYFPTQLLGYDEPKFDDLILKAIKNPNKKGKIISCITAATERNGKTMEFVNMWQKAVPSIVSQGLFSNLTGSGFGELANKFGIQTIVNNSSSVGKKFMESDYQTDIILKEGKSLATGAIASKLFLLANADPEPYTKAALYAASIIVGGYGYTARGKDSQKIQDKQFLDSTKELIKLGVVDPHSLINSVSEKPLKLTGEKLKEYHNWKDRRTLDLRYFRTGTYKTAHNDFLTEEAKNVLIKTFDALKHMGFGDEKISKFTSVLGLVYFSGRETQEAQYLLTLSLNMQKKLYGQDSPNLLNTMQILARVQEENEEPIASRKTLQEILKITETSSPNDIESINIAKKKLLLADLKLTIDLKEKEKLLCKDYDISITPSRYTEIKDKLLPEVRKNSQEAVDESAKLLGQLQSLTLNKNEYIQIFEVLSMYEDEPSLKDLGQSLLKTFETHPMFSELSYNDMSPESYYKLIKMRGQTDFRNSRCLRKTQRSINLRETLPFLRDDLDGIRVNMLNTLMTCDGKRLDDINNSVKKSFTVSQATKLENDLTDVRLLLSAQNDIINNSGFDSLYRARFLQELGKDINNEDIIQHSLSIYKKVLGETALETIRCKIQYAIIGLNKENLEETAEFAEKTLSTEQKNTIRNELSELYLKAGVRNIPKEFEYQTGFWSSTEALQKTWLIMDDFIHLYFGRTLDYNPNNAEKLLSSIKKSNSYKNGDLRWTAVALDGGGKPYAKSPQFYNLETIIEKFLLKHINESQDKFALNQRFLLNEKRDSLLRFFFLEESAKEKINVVIRRIESNIKLMKIK